MQERSDQIAEWVRLTEEKRKVSQVATPGGKQPKDAGIRAASRELGIDKDAVHRAAKIASLSDEAKDAAQELLKLPRLRGRLRSKRGVTWS